MRSALPVVGVRCPCCQEQRSDTGREQLFHQSDVDQSLTVYLGQKNPHCIGYIRPSYRCGKKQSRHRFP